MYVRYVQGCREAFNIGGGGGCRHVLTNFSEDFDQVLKMFPGNVVDGGGKVKNIFVRTIS